MTNTQSFLKKHHGPNIERGQRRKIAATLGEATRKQRRLSKRPKEAQGFKRGARVKG